MHLPQASAVAGRDGRWTIVSLIVVLGIVATIRVRLLDLPLERDEGEFAYAAQLLLQGVSPFDWAYNAMLKLPGTFVSYALSMAVFGQTAAGIHAGLLLVNLANSVLVFLLGRRIAGDGGGVVAAGIFALLALTPATLGLAAHATHFVLLPALAGLLLLQTLEEHTSSRRIFWAGLLLGLAFCMKQTGACFGAFAAIWILRCEWIGGKSWPRACRRLGWLAIGGALPILLTILVVAQAGGFHRFWFWGFVYASAHGSVISWQNGLVLMFAKLAAQFTAAPALWSLAIAGLLVMLNHPLWRPWRFFVGGLALSSFLSVCPGWYFREHYFIQLLPVTGLLAGMAFRSARTFMQGLPGSHRLAMVPSVVVGGAIASSLIQWSALYFQMTPPQVSRAIYGSNPFPEAVTLARYLESQSTPEARIAILGSEPELFFYSHRRSATGYICIYPLMENQPYANAMRTEMFQEIVKARPQFVIYVHVESSWVQFTGETDNTVANWFDHYQRDELRMIGFVEILPDQPAKFWSADTPATEAHLASGDWLAVFQRR